MSRPSERGLSHLASDAQFADAMARCQNASGDCSVAGKCLYGGCFASGPEIDAAGMIESIIPDDGRAGVHLAYLRKCAEMLRAGMITL